MFISVLDLQTLDYDSLGNMKNESIRNGHLISHLFSSFKSFLDLVTISPSEIPSAPFAMIYVIMKVSFSPDIK
jgi:hypothetical protein